MGLMNNRAKQYNWSNSVFSYNLLEAYIMFPKIFKTLNTNNMVKHKPTKEASKTTRLLEHKLRESYLQWSRT